MSMTQTMSGTYSYLGEKWWMLLLRGACGVLFGVLAFLWPWIALFSIVIVYGVFILMDGLLALGASFGKERSEIARRNRKTSRGWLILVGIVGLAAGLLMLINPMFGAAVLIACVGLWSLFRGAFELVWFFQHRKAPESGWLLLDAVISLLFGIMVLAWPAVSAVALTWGLGIFALVTGVLQIIFAIKLRRNTV